MLYDRYLREYANLFRNTDRDLWNYEEGCVLIGMLALYRATGDEFYFEGMRRFVDRYILPDGTIRRYDPSEYNLDYIATGCVLFPLWQKTGEARYRTAIETLAEQLRHQPRAACGSFWHKAIYPNQVWLDGLYMGLPYYAQYDVLFEDGRHMDDILLQFRNARRYLRDEATGLYYHAWNETKDVFWADPETGRSPNFWLRALGWFLMAMADIYELLPDNRSDLKEELAAQWKECIDAILAVQDKDTGLFYQLPSMPNEPGNYLETSGSLMVAYSLLKGARLGVLAQEQYRRAGEQIMMGVERYQFQVHNGKVSLDGMCKGAGLGPAGNLRRNGTVAYYLSEDVVADEQKGVGVCMMAYAEYLRARNAGALAQDFPLVDVFSQQYDPILPDDPQFAAFEAELTARTAQRRS